MAVLSRQKQPDGQTSKFQRQTAFSLLSRANSLSAAGPSYCQQKQAQWPFYQRKAKWPLYPSRSNRMARPPDFSNKLHFCYYPARSVYQRPGQAILSKIKPNGRFINARPNGCFIKAEATGWPDLQFSPLSRTINLLAAGPSYSQQKQAQWPFYQRKAKWPLYPSRSNRMARPPDLSDKLHFRYYPARSVYQRPGQAILSKIKPNGRFINAKPNGRYINAEAAGWPDLQISATNCIFAIIPHDQFISGRAKLFSAKAGPMAVLSTRGPITVLSRAATG